METNTAELVKDDEVQEFAKFLGITPSQFLQGVGVQKAKKDENQRVLGAASKVNVHRGFYDNPFDSYNTKGVLNEYPPIPHNTLRETAKKNPVIASIINTRRMQLRPFSMPSKDDNSPGYTIALKDIEAKPSKEEINKMKQIEEWFFNTGNTDFEGHELREDNLTDAMTKYGRDILEIDQVAIEIRRDKVGDPVDFWTMDGSTIKKVVSGGFQGNKTDFDPRTYILKNTKFFEKLIKDKVQLIPPMEEIAYVQQVQARYVAAFTRKDLIFETMNKRTDVRYMGMGYSLTEQAMTVVTAFLWGLAYNAEAFNSGTLPKIALAFKDANFSVDQMIDLQDQFIANFRGIAGAFRIPMLNTEATVLDLNKSPRDMEYMKYLEFVGSLICSVFGIDSAEMGLRFAQAQNVLSESQGTRQKFSKDRGLNDLLGAIANTYNKIMMLNGWADKFIFKFTGIEPEDKKNTSELMSAASKRDKMVDEIRAEQDLEPLPDGLGQVILDPTWIQFAQNKQMEKQQAEAQETQEAEGGEDEFDDDVDTAVDEGFDSMFKAIDPVKVRTLLK